MTTLFIKTKDGAKVLSHLRRLHEDWQSLLDATEDLRAEGFSKDWALMKVASCRSRKEKLVAAVDYLLALPHSSVLTSKRRREEASRQFSFTVRRERDHPLYWPSDEKWSQLTATLDLAVRDFDNDPTANHETLEISKDTLVYYCEAGLNLCRSLLYDDDEKIATLDRTIPDPS
ncbi:hypothetical protein P7C73_g5930, partial [Tremellales sp. Uapishka_1]